MRYLRLIGLALTIHYTLWAMVVFVDLLAYQCGGSPACRGQYLLGWFNSTIGFLGSSPLRHAVLFSLFPMLVVGLLAVDHPERSGRLRTLARARAEAQPGWTALCCRIRSSGRPPWTTRRLAEAHGVAALAAVGAVLAGVARTVTAGARPELAGLEIALWGLCAAAAGACAGGRLGAPPAGGCGTLGPGDPDDRSGGRCYRSARSVPLSWNASIDPGSLPPVLVPLRDAFDGVMIAQFALLMLYYLKDQPRMFLAIPADRLGPLPCAQPACARPGPAMDSPTRAAVGSMAARGRGIASLSLGVYGCATAPTGSKIKAGGTAEPRRSRPHLSNQFWIFFALAPMFIAVARRRPGRARGRLPGVGRAGGAGGVRRLPDGAFRIQVTRAHDYAPRWKLRVGGPATLAAVGAAGLTLVSAAVIVFAAQRLGSAGPVSRPAGGRARGRASATTRSWAGSRPPAWVRCLSSSSPFAPGPPRCGYTASKPRFRRSTHAWASWKACRGGCGPGSRVRMAKARASACLLDDLDWMVTVGIVAFLACSSR